MTTIAVIDDDQSLLDLMVEVLSERHWTTLTVTESDSTTDLLREAQPDAILLDIHLAAQHTGWHVLEQLQADGATRDIPVVIWTADVKGIVGKHEWLAKRGIPVLEKPFEIDDLFRSLDTALARKHQANASTSRLSA